MRKLLFSFLPAVLGMAFLANNVQAAPRIGIEIGPEPVCPYGYYDAPPYTCAPYGYYGPEWFNGGVFIGSGPWYHGRDRFWGRVDRRFDHDHYRGRFPDRGERAEHRMDRMNNFHGDEHRDGHGHHH